MSFQKIYEIGCDGCMTTLKHVYSIAEAKQVVRESGWITSRLTMPDFGRGPERQKEQHFCSEFCRDEARQDLKAQSEMIKERS